MRGAYTGSLHAPSAHGTLRPAFSWAAVATTCGAVHYELQADDSCRAGALDACTFPSPELDAKDITTTSYTPATDLKVSTVAPVGAFYAWHARACDPSARCGPWSEVRYVQVGRVREDINGDGYGDLLALSDRGIEVYLGSAQFDVAAPSATIAYDNFGTPTFSGDVNGDGYGDFFAPTGYAPSRGPVPTIYFGGPTTAPRTLLLTKAAGGPSTMMQTRSAGDMNGDGFADLIVQWGYSLTTPQTELRVFFGGDDIASEPGLSIPGPYESFETLQYSGRVGDINGDGFEDIGLTAYDGRANAGLVEFFAGGMRPAPTPTIVATTASNQQLEGAGDVDGDGFDDVLLVRSGGGHGLYRGAATLPTNLTMTWADPTASSGAGGFDFDRDGFADFIVGTNTNAPVLYRGRAAVPSIVPNGYSRLEISSVVAFSDHDGDGGPDLIGVGALSETIWIQWAGSDGTANPLAFDIQLPANVTFSGRIVR
jgi:hypothetical protein